MSWLDLIPYLLVTFFVLILVWLICDYVWIAVFPTINQSGNEEIAATLDTSWDKSKEFADGSYVALFLIIGVIGCVLTVFLAGHPIMLIAWLFINLIALFLYDIFNDFLTVFLLTDLNTGMMSTAVSFFQNGMPKAIIILNMLMALIFLGKRGMSQ